MGEFRERAVGAAIEQIQDGGGTWRVIVDAGLKPLFDVEHGRTYDRVNRRRTVQVVEIVFASKLLKALVYLLSGFSSRFQMWLRSL